MRDYGIVSPRFWIGKTGRELRKRPYAQRVALYLMTAPSSEMTGVFYCPVSTILNDVGSPFDGASKGHERDIEGVKSALKALQSLGFCFYDFETEHVFVKEMAKWQIAAKLMPTDKRVKGILRYVETMPEPLRARFVRRYNDDFSLKLSVPPEPEDGSSFEAPSIPLRSQEQDQEQEQEQEYIETPYGVSRRLSVESSTPASAVSSSEKEEILQAPQSADASVNDSAADKAPRKAAPVPYEKIVDLYNAKLGPVLGMCRDLNAARRSALKSRWADVASAIGVSHYDTADVLEGFGEYFDKIARSDFLMGRRSDGGWHATFDWLIKSSNYLKVFEGNYENSRRK